MPGGTGKGLPGFPFITRSITLTAPLNDQQKATLADIVEKTPVTKTIKAGAAIETKFL